MGLAKNQQQEGRDGKQGKKGRRGSVNVTKRLDAFKEASGGGGADWSTCDAGRLLAVVHEITTMGGAITIGLSRDQGAHFLTLLLDDARTTLWFNGDANLTEELQRVLVTLEDM